MPESSEKPAANASDQIGQVEGIKKRTQVMADSVFSFAELGFQEVETSRYLTNILEKEGFKIERGVAGIPTAWIASWGSGKPVISSARTSIASHKPRRSPASLTGSL